MRRREYLTRVAGVGALAATGATTAGAQSLSQHTVLTIQDGTGDNFGSGSLTHPTNADFYDGVWDVSRLEVRQDDSTVYFEFEMATEIQNPFGVSGGWSHEFFQIYIRDPGADTASGTNGRNGLLANFTDPYHYRVVAHGDGLTAVEGPNGSELSTEVSVNVQTSTFLIEVPRSAIGGDITDKELAVLICPYDGFGTGGLRAIASSNADYTIGGGTESTPRVMDMITGEGQDQSSILETSGFGAPQIPFFPVTSDGSDGGSDGGNQPEFTLPGQSNPAVSTDGDALLEDVDGDGSTGLSDAEAYYNNRKSDVIRNNPDQFDFDGDGESGTLFDTLALFNKIS